MNETPNKATSVFGPVFAFFVLSYAIAWSVFGLFWIWARDLNMASAEFVGMVEAWHFSGIDGSLPAPKWLLYLLTRIMDFSFTIAGLVLIGMTEGVAGFRRIGCALVQWRIPLRWYIAASLPLFLYAIATLLAVMDTNAVGDSFVFGLREVGAALFSLEAGIVIYFFLRGAMGEEIGLRGFALHRLQQRLSPASASVVIGVLWGAWHLPVLVGRPPAQIVLYLVLVLFLSFIFTWLYNGAGGSLIPVMLFHTFQNAEEIFEVFWPGLRDVEWEAPSSIGLLLIGLIVTIVLSVYSIRRAPTQPSVSDVS